MSTEEEWGTGAITVIAIASILLVCVSGYAVHACNIADKASLGQIEQDVDTHNFEHSKAYRDGLRHDFDELQLSYAHAKSVDEKTVILSTIRHRASSCPPEFVPQDIKDLLRANP